MSDRINAVPSPPTAAHILLFEAMCMACPEPEKMRAMFGMGSKDTDVTVVLTVGGVEVPFLTAVNEAWARMAQQHDEDVREAASTFFQDGPLAKIRNHLDNLAFHAELTEAAVLEEIERLSKEREA